MSANLANDIRITLPDGSALHSGHAVLELGQLSSVADYMILATGNSDPHLRALRIEVEKAMDEVGSPSRASESQPDSRTKRTASSGCV